MKIYKCLLAITLITSLISCSSVSSQEDIDAVITNHTMESLRELRQTIAEALNQRPVTIAKSAFLNSSRLLLSFKKPIGPDGRPIQTNIDEKPIEMRLFISGKKCYLRNQKTGLEFELTQADCQPKI